MKKLNVEFKKDGWTVVQNADGHKHELEIICRAENGIIVETRVRHHSGEEQKGSVTLNGQNALPLSIEDFKKYFESEELVIR